MKHSSLGILGILFVSIPLVTFAVDTISGPVNDDLFFPRGVLIEGVEGPENNEAMTGSSSVTIEGVGTVTVADSRLGSFPRLMVSGGTTITSKRVWTKETLRKTWWDGQFSSPSSGREPNWDQVKFAPGQRTGDGEKLVDTFQWGLANETFTYSPSAAVVLPVTEKTGVKLYAAFPKSADDWLVDKTNYCVVQDGLCAIEVSEVSALTLIKETYSQCSKQDIANGKSGGVPDCTIVCDRGYYLNDDATGCVEDDSFLDGEDMGESSMDPYEEEVTMVQNEEAPNIRNGYVRYRGSRAQLNPSINENEVVDVEELTSARRRNAATSVRTNDVDLTEDSTAEEEDGFLNYLLQMRNRYENHNVNDFTDYGAIESEETVEEKSKTYSAAPMLPSTGPEMFAILAIAGLMLMVFGVSRKRN